jgi:Tfp pilus assembly protein PilF
MKVGVCQRVRRGRGSPVGSALSGPACLAVAVSLVMLAAGHGLGKERYNLWAKEKLRYIAEKVQRDPYNAKLQVLLGDAYFQDGQNYEAEQHLKKALELRPEFAEAHCNLAGIYHAQMRMTEARQHYEKALGIDSTLVEARAGLGTLLCRNQLHAQGIRHLETVLLQDSRRVNVRYNLGVAYHTVGDFKRAISHLGQVLEQRPNFPSGRGALAQANFGWGLRQLQAKQLQRALGFMEKALALDPTQADFHYAQGLAYLGLENLDPAARAFAAAVEIEANHVPALHNLATVYELTGRDRDAEPLFRRVLELTPHLDTIQAARNADYDSRFLLK